MRVHDISHRINLHIFAFQLYNRAFVLTTALSLMR